VGPLVVSPSRWLKITKLTLELRNRIWFGFEYFEKYVIENGFKCKTWIECLSLSLSLSPFFFFEFICKALTDTCRIFRGIACLFFDINGNFRENFKTVLIIISWHASCPFWVWSVKVTI